ncbi:endonuclease domain-containing protein [Caulobacter vibrioides]|uniref:Very short patch repair (Vsr) endonuclease n=1 Tax=Caulobacter vibrioides (strain NA1000 / CB15N) TaxID=565050 RepID=A0A0H3CDB8_CAUVN|nr:endonuclease domain-containing protein [Caulobacter vibrioides]YP_002518250.1 very short patch repair (Vsr) endonuclease [Caulobacter vibrioides NA1000]ACL96342.1 very short patch repair (Vsr) endonuclease [Caulobacter vibrioides NA1000]ATC30698.1 endonuclease domain-containing protein [Caulobacter vibrioides]AZH14850.1 endonuclease domain-containing protein [Caulobacter vibrioides]QXZ51143.1 endonuclease domain-containing protein [Caulobacter vibrioides]
MQTPRDTVTTARRLRREMSPPEARLWAALRRGGLDGLKFRRQHPMGRCVLDFYCPSLKLAIEVDGYAHCINERPTRDAARDQWLLAQGVRTLRIPAHDVLESVEGALGQIRTFMAANRLWPPTGDLAPVNISPPLGEGKSLSSSTP